MTHSAAVRTSRAGTVPGRATAPTGAAGPAEEPFLPWLRREWLLVMITVGVAVDWLPWFLTPYLPQFGQLSGTRLLVVPGLALACLLRPSWIARPSAIGVLYLAAIAVGGGLGYLAGTVELSRLTSIVVSGLILLYFLQVRSLVSARRVLAITFALTPLVPAVQCLTKVGVISAATLAAMGIAQVPGDTRIFSIFDSTTVGLAPLMIAACLGGLIFVQSRRHRTVVDAILAVGVIGFGATSALVAQQRSGILAYAISTVTALVLYVVSQRRRTAWMTTILLVFGAAAIVSAYFAADMTSQALSRFANTSAYQDARELRLGGLTTFLADLADDPLNPVPKGHQSLLHRTGVEPHLLLSEAYYEGGPIFLVVIVFIVYKFARACVALARSDLASARTIGICLCAFGCGAALQVSLQTALALRLIPMVLGVGIAAARTMRASGVTTGEPSRMGQR
ncbi:MAG TPA: hypothetical protein VJN96_18595 [Vicinamibacterales bacterium]|nr:hypothetical protein [Vicinamibacterales bacterium]